MKTWNGKVLSNEISLKIKDSVVDSNEKDVYINPEKVYEVLKFLKETSGFSFDLLSSITAVDYIDHFEVVYHLNKFSDFAKLATFSSAFFSCFL